jgi:predicted Fe-Mo cluster-binding NifX family protein
MKIVFASKNNQGLRSTLCNDLGRCPYYTVVDLDGDRLRNIKIVTNQYLESNISSLVPVFINSLGARVIIASGMKPQVLDLFKQFGIEAVTTGAESTLKDILLGYLRGEIKGAFAFDPHH